MRKRLTSLVLLLVLMGSVFAGVPLPSGESECSMGQAMEGMDCCQAALMGGQALEVTEARLCCAINCSHDGATPPSGVRVAPRTQHLVSDFQPGAALPPAAVLLTRHISHSHGPPLDSHPAYIRHLALLI